jgi:hypothetical protein
MAKEYRTIEVVLDGEFEGFSATMRADGISARIFVDLSSSSVERQMEAVKKLVIKHNFKDVEGETVEDILDAPMDSLAALVAKWGEAVSALPPR